MRSKIGVIIFAIIGLTVFAKPAQALVFSDLVDLWGSFGVVGPGNTGGSTQNDGASNPDVAWMHDILAEIAPDLIGNIIISDAKLTISYKDVSTSTETWNLTGDGNALGSLPNYTGANPNTVDFNLTAAALAALQADGVLNAGLEETTSGNDNFRMYQSVLSGNYTLICHHNGDTNDVGVVPEPGSLLLMGTGLLGFLGGGRLLRRKNLKG